MQSNITEELKSVLRENEELLGRTFALMEEGISSPTEMASKGAGANAGAAGNNKQVVNAILNRIIPQSSEIARRSASAISRIIKSNPNLSLDTQKYLGELKEELVLRSTETSAIVHDAEVLEKRSDELSSKFEKFENSIYVYTFPTYFRAGLDTDSELKWLKIGSTSKGVWKRIVEQNRQTSMPEDPLLLRIYYKENMDVLAVERKIQEVLSKVRHERSSARHTKAGIEWYATTLEALDAITDLMGLESVAIATTDL